MPSPLGRPGFTQALLGPLLSQRENFELAQKAGAVEVSPFGQPGPLIGVRPEIALGLSENQANNPATQAQEALSMLLGLLVPRPLEEDEPIGGTLFPPLLSGRNLGTMLKPQTFFRGMSIKELEKTVKAGRMIKREGGFPEIETFGLSGKTVTSITSNPATAIEFAKLPGRGALAVFDNSGRFIRGYKLDKQGELIKVFDIKEQ